LEFIDGSPSGRVAYVMDGNVLPAASCEWRLDETFNIENELLHDPDKAKAYKVALETGSIIIDQP